MVGLGGKPETRSSSDLVKSPEIELLARWLLLNKKKRKYGPLHKSFVVPWRTLPKGGSISQNNESRTERSSIGHDVPFHVHVA